MPDAEAPAAQAATAEPSLPRGEGMVPLSDLIARIQKRREAKGRVWDPLEPEPPYLDVPGVDRDCPRCKGKGWLRHDVDIYDPRFGKLVKCPDCYGKAVEHGQVIHRAQQIPPHMRDLTLVSFPGNPPALIAVREWTAAAEAAIAEPPLLPWLFLTGARGHGKTGLAVAAAMHLAGRRNLGLVYGTVPDILDRLRATYSADAQERIDDVLSGLQTADIAVFDDLGAQKTTEWAAEKLFQLFDYRYLHGLLTLITTNLSLEKLAATDNVARIADRITEMALEVEVGPPNLRKMAADAHKAGTPWPPTRRAEPEPSLADMPPTEIQDLPF